jgi:hypothetical protein
MKMGLGRLNQRLTTHQVLSPHRPFLSRLTVDSVSMKLHASSIFGRDDEMLHQRYTDDFHLRQINFSKQILEGNNK